MAVFFSLANGIGRIAWGSLSDKLGRKRSVIIMTATQGIFLLLFTTMAGNEYMLYLGAALIGFNFGGNFALFPAFTADKFGNDAVGQNYPWVFLSYGAGGIIFPILGGWLGDIGNFPLAFTICGAGCLIGAVAAYRCSRRTRTRQLDPSACRASCTTPTCSSTSRRPPSNKRGALIRARLEIPGRGPVGARSRVQPARSRVAALL